MYVLPSDVRQFTVTIDGSQLTETGVSEVTMIGAGFNMVVADLVLDPGQQDTIYVDVENDEYLALNYESDYSDSPDIWFGLATDDADYEFIVRGSDTEAERAALARLAQGSGSVPNGATDEMFAAAREHYTDDQLAAIVAVASICSATSTSGTTSSRPPSR